MRFDWDPEKNELNIRKHAVSFEEAQEAFFDPNALEEYDEEQFHYERAAVQTPGSI